MIHCSLALSIALCFNATFMSVATQASRKLSVQLRAIAAVPLLALTAATFCQVFIAAQGPDDLRSFGLIVAIAAVTVCGITDAQTGFVFDAVSLPATAIILLCSAADRAFTPALEGAAAAAGCMALLYTFTHGRGLGLGDVKLASCIGSALGTVDGLTSLGVSFVLGANYAVFVLAARRAKRHDIVYFAPYLACGTIVVALYRALA